MPDKVWKRLERKIGKLLGGERVKRMGDYATSATDVIIPDLPELRIDCKLRRRLPLHDLFRNIRRRYEKEPPVLFTKERQSREVLCTIEIDHFVRLVNAVRRNGTGGPTGIKHDLVIKHRFAHHGMLRTIRQRYCRESGSPVLVTKEYGRHLYLATIEEELFSRLLGARQNSALGARDIRSRTASAGGFRSRTTR